MCSSPLEVLPDQPLIVFPRASFPFLVTASGPVRIQRGEAPERLGKTADLASVGPLHLVPKPSICAPLTPHLYPIHCPSAMALQQFCLLLTQSEHPSSYNVNRPHRLYRCIPTALPSTPIARSIPPQKGHAEAGRLIFPDVKHSLHVARTSSIKLCLAPNIMAEIFATLRTDLRELT